MRATWNALSGWSRRWGTAETVENLVIGGTLTAVTAAIAIREVRGPNSRVPGRMAGGGGVHVITRPGGGPTVLFENGLGYPATMWSWVQRGLPAQTASIAYDRPGIGWSPAQRRSTALAYPESLRATARSVAAYAPFILVGHSVGGLLTRIFARHFPELVGGMVFVDSAHPAQYVRSPGQAAALEQLRNDLDQMIVRGRLGMPPSWNSTMPLFQLPPDVAQITSKVTFQPRNLRAARRELDVAEREWSAHADELTALGRPVAVISAQQSLAKDPVMDELHQELADLSPVNRRVVVPGADHLTVLTHQPFAAHVTDAITWIINELSPATAKPAAQQGGQK
ncbi:acetoin dehydrogenase E2 subunit dihydrolipoyllysine-residue acetyltransferase [Streptomyces sp. MA5143a]|nr:acetoin dehydrogenase E2 subunit dihydrolipoyllysine-residue acetyltransferase [Streptomyces sp. MA5143a]